MVDVVEEDTEVCRMFTLLDLDKMFEQNPDARIVNNEALVSKKLSVEFTNAIYSQSDGELGFVPTCQCGEIKGVAKEGLYCSKCHTFCTSQFIDSLSHTSWLGLPQHMPPVLHPVWYMVLRNWASVGRRNVTIIDIILNPEEDVPEDFVPYLKGRGFKYFYEHVDEMMDMLLHKYPRTAKNKAAQHIETFMKHWKSVMFTRHLPVLHNSLHPLKSSGGTLKYADSTSQEILSAIIDLSAETFAEHASHVNERQQSKTLFDIFSRVMTYYRSLIKEKLGGKTAMLRKHDFGSRIHYSFRAVVTPHDCILPMDEVILAWGIMCNGLKLPILNFLMNRHFKSVSESITIFRNALLKYDPLVDQCIQEYIQECPGGRMPVAVGRNPTLAYGSIMKLYVRNYRKDPHDETMSINACIVTPANIDFDGDEIYGFFIFEDELSKAMTSIHPSQFLFSTTSPGLSSRIGLLTQNYVTVESFLEDDEEDSAYYQELS